MGSRLPHSEKVEAQQRVQTYRSVGPQRFARFGGAATDPRFKQFPKSRPAGQGSAYLMWDETSLMERDHLYAEQLAAVSRRSQ